jgi:purine-nucleoside phosphorylase
MSFNQDVHMRATFEGKTIPSNTPDIPRAVEQIRARVDGSARVALVLGSGLGILADEIVNPKRFSYSDIAGFPVSRVPGHRGEFVSGELEGVPVLVFRGRFHFYEGYSFDEITFPFRCLPHLGTETLLLSNAAGGLNPTYRVGEFMSITDHVRLQWRDPLRTWRPSEGGQAVPPQYSDRIRTIARTVAEERGIVLHEGVFGMALGPSYETLAETRLLRAMGADAVSMSTVPEVTFACAAGLEVYGISCITNSWANQTTEVSHDEVMDVGARVGPTFVSLLKGVVQRLDHREGQPSHSSEGVR